MRGRKRQTLELALKNLSKDHTELFRETNLDSCCYDYLVGFIKALFDIQISSCFWWQERKRICTLKKLQDLEMKMKDSEPSCSYFLLPLPSYKLEIL